jgi:uncharacterized protein (TIGR00661 family)
MNAEPFPVEPHILIAPLDWGLGHATRCIPIIQLLIQKGCKVTLAGEGQVKKLLQKEFPDLNFLELKGYRVSYSKQKWQMPFKIAAQIPQILGSIKEEQEWLQNAAQENKIDGIISDNRYGLYHATLPSVFITHQLNVKTPMGEWGETLTRNINYHFINRFSFCWVPDMEGEGNLAGDLAHPVEKPAIPITYLGPLSRFTTTEEKEEDGILVILSGPEPQRTSFEDMIIQDLRHFNGKATIVRGIPGEGEKKDFPLHAEFFDHLPAKQLMEKISAASIVIGRCGYSTVMDLAVMKKKSILIPTPGQTEQEYLGEHLMKINFALCIDQEKFRLKQALDLASHFNYRSFVYNNNDLEAATDEFLTAARKKRKEESNS